MTDLTEFNAWFVDRWVRIIPADPEKRKVVARFVEAHPTVDDLLLVLEVNGHEWRMYWGDIARLKLHSADTADPA